MHDLRFQIWHLQPDDITLRTMFHHNPHGAGYMYARDGKVTIHKGFMNIRRITSRRSARNTSPRRQRGVPLSNQHAGGRKPRHDPSVPAFKSAGPMRTLDLTCRSGVAHNGVIRLTCDPNNKRYSDTAIFVADYLSRILHTRPTSETGYAGTRLPSWPIQIRHHGRLRLRRYSGHFIHERGLLFSNDSYQPAGGS